MKNKPQWRKMFMALRSITVGLVHRNLIAAFPDKNVSLLKIQALTIVEAEIKKKMERP